MNFLKEILYGNSDQDYIHQKFVKYGRGEFDGPAINVKKSGDSVKISATYDYSNILGWILAKNSIHELKVSGNIISKRDIGKEVSNILGISAKGRKKIGVFSFDIKGDFNPDVIQRVYENLKDSAIFFDISSEKGCGGEPKALRHVSETNVSATNLKTKKKLPKPGAGIDKRFCSATFDPSVIGDIMSEILF